MNPVDTDPGKRITHLVPRQSQAITEMLAIEASVRGLEGSAQDLTDAQQKVVEIARLIAVALEPPKLNSNRCTDSCFNDHSMVMDPTLPGSGIRPVEPSGPCAGTQAILEETAHEARVRHLRLNEFRETLKGLSLAELIRLATTSRAGTLQRKDEWRLIGEQIGLRYAEHAEEKRALGPAAPMAIMLPLAATPWPDHTDFQNG